RLLAITYFDKEIQPMNTLPRAVTARFFTDPDGYYALRRCWSALMNSESKRELTAAQHMLYLALCGKDWRRAFTPISNPRKLANGAYHGWALLCALRVVNSPLLEGELLAPFGDLVTPETLRLVRGYLQHLNLHVLGPRAFGGGSFPFDAFSATLATTATEDRAARSAGNG